MGKEPGNYTLEIHQKRSVPKMPFHPAARPCTAFLAMCHCEGAPRSWQSGAMWASSPTKFKHHTLRRGGVLPRPPLPSHPHFCRGGRPCPPVGVSGVRYAAGGGQPTLHYIMLLCGAWGRGCKRPFARQQGGGAPRPVGGIFASYLFRSSKFSAVTMDWTLVHRGAKVLARSS